MYINGNATRVFGADVFLPLSSYLRYKLYKTGTKVVCAEGDCGACSVLVAFPERKIAKGAPEFKVMNSCISPLYILDGASVVTIEGLKNEGSSSEVQKKMTECFGSQCGFCTPGFVVAMTAMFECHKKVDASKVKNFTTGNLCRCTGYEPIIAAGLAVDATKLRPLSKSYLTPQIKKELISIGRTEFEIETPEKQVLGPTTVSQVSNFLIENKLIRIVSAATDLGVQFNKEKIDLEKTITLHHIPGLFEISKNKGAVSIGAKVTLATIQETLTKELPTFCRFLNVFASPQIRNVATLVGNIVNASPIGDTLPYLFVSGAIVEIQGLKSCREVPIINFYKGYKKTALLPGEWISRVIVPQQTEHEEIYLYKVSQRRDLDISSVVAAFYIQKGPQKINDIKIAYGGVGPTVLRLPKTETYLTRQRLSPGTLSAAQKILQSEITPISDLRASEAFRRKVSSNLLEKFYLESGALA